MNPHPGAFSVALTTNGIDVPADFPTGPYENIHAIVAAKRSSHANYGHYAGASNAVAYRFKAAIEYGDAFALSLKTHSTAPAPQGRYNQEKFLFGFFSSGFSVLESVFFELFVLGAFVAPAKFPLATPQDQQLVTPKRTLVAFTSAFPADPILKTLTAVFADPGYQAFRETRNILTHRAAPGRLMYVSIGSDDVPTADWKLNNLLLDDTIASKGRGQLAHLATVLLEGGANFAVTQIK
jgi:hypothetical protein